MASRARRKISISIPNSRWAAYAVAGAATGGAFTTNADAAIVYMSVNQPVNAPPDTSVAFPFTLAGNAANQIIFSHFRSASGNSGVGAFGIKGAVSAGFIGIVSNSYRYVGKLAFGAQINGGAFLNLAGGATIGGLLASFGGYPHSQWKTAGTGFIGFEFNAGGGMQFGWARITVAGVPGNNFTVVDFAYAGVGETITAGQVPEPGSLALLALGGGGLLLWRMRRARVESAA